MRRDNLKFSLAPKGWCACILLLAATAANWQSPAAVHAATIQIDITGLNLRYDVANAGPNIYDETGAVYNTTRSAIYPNTEASAVATLDFFLDGVLQGSLTTDVFVDVFIKDAMIPLAGGLVNTGGNGNTFGIDLMTSSAGILGLNLDDVTITHLPDMLMVESGVASSVAFQNLSFGLPAIDFTKPILFALTSVNVTNVTDNGVNLTSFEWSGTGTIKMTAVPEPASWTLACGFGFVVLGARRFRQSRGSVIAMPHGCIAQAK